MSELPYLNLGCGNHYDNRWTNIDFISSSKEVIAYNLKNGIPFKDNSFDVVYHSHVLEHFTKIDGANFINECKRVLKSNGIIRIAVPDLEQIINNYSVILSKLMENPNDEYLFECYNWIMLELYDQTVRNKSGGSMSEYLAKEIIINEDFIVKRCGFEISPVLEYYKQKRAGIIQEEPPFYPTLKERVKMLPATLKRKLLKLILTDSELAALNVGKFRFGGEVHYWMYDKFSLMKLLKTSGFSNIEVCGVSESKILNWEDYELETINGYIRKPDSLFMEANIVK